MRQRPGPGVAPEIPHISAHVFNMPKPPATIGTTTASPAINPKPQAPQPEVPRDKADQPKFAERASRTP